MQNMPVFAFFLMVTVTVTGCAGQETRRASDSKEAEKENSVVGKNKDKIEGGTKEALVSPLNDFNLVHAKLPPVLVEAQKAPYALQADASCEGLKSEINSLSEALGADLDERVTKDNPGLLERGTNAVGDAAVNVVKGTVQSAIPYRGWIRKLSGAEKYSKEVAAAIAAGGVRRAFLKGVRKGRGCDAG